MSNFLRKKFFHPASRAKTLKSFTLSEVLLSATIFSFVVVGTLAGYVTFAALNENSRNTAKAIFEARKLVESSMLNPGSDIIPLMPIDDPKGLMQVQRETVATGLYNMRVAVSWVEKGGRLIGEIKVNPDGSLDWDDLDQDGEMDSPVVIQAATNAQI